MARIPDHLLNRIKEEVLVETLARRRGVELRKVGENLVGLCVFHPDKNTPNLVITPGKNVWHCFVCQIGGSPIDWVMHERGVRTRQALEILVAEFFPLETAAPGAPPPRRTRVPQLGCPLDETADDRQLALDVVGYYHGVGKGSVELHDYLKRRGILSEETFDHFRLGYANRTLGYRLPSKATVAGRSIRSRLEKLGFFRDSGHEHLSGSLTVPIFGEEGDVLGCYGRKLLSNLRVGTPKHLYLPGPHRGVFNVEALKASSEILLCEALLDAVKAWEEGFRNVTSAYGASGFNEEMLDAFVRFGTEKVLIAYDRDEAGDKGAQAVAEKLLAKGIDCYRVLFPHGMDLSTYSLKVQPARRALDVVVRGAQWMGNGRKPSHGVVDLGAGSRPMVSVVSPVAAQATLPLAASPLAAPPSAARATLLVAETPSPAALTAREPGEAAKEEKLEKAAEEENIAPLAEPLSVARDEPMASALAPPAELTEPVASELAPALAPALAPSAAPEPSGRKPDDNVVCVSDDEVRFTFGDRRYRVRGMKRATGFGILKLNLLATREGDYFEGAPISGLHADTFDLYLARSRNLFEKQASMELGVKEEVVKRDLSVMLRKLEDLQAEAVRKAQEPKVKKVLLSEKETAEALDFWRAPGLLSRIVEDVTLCGLVGEETNKLVTYVAAVSRLLDRPLAVIIQSSSAAGKTSLMEAVLSLLPEEDREKYTAVSGKSLFYFDGDVSLRHKVLAIVEEEGAEKATYPLKLLQSEGELIMASTGKDPHTGKLVTQVYRVEGPVMIILTTTAIELDPELENRCLRLTVDESREQTRRIHELQRQRQTLEGLFARKRKENVQRLHRNAQRLLRPVKVLNPYVSELTFVDDQTRTRRDHEKYLTLIESIALLHQYQRPITRREIEGDSVECVEVTLDDIEVANRLAGEVLGKTLDELPPQTRRFLGELYQRVRAIAEEQGVEQCDLRFSRRDVRDLTGWRDTQVRLHMARLIELEYVLVHRGGRGQSFVYELLYRGEGTDGRPFVLGLADVAKLRGDGTGESVGVTDAAGDDAPDTSDTSDTTTTSSVSGFSTGVAGGSRGLRGPIAAPVRGDESSAEPAPAAASSDPEPAEPRNARLPAAGNVSSYPTRHTRTAARHGPHAPSLRLNLLRFPPVDAAPLAPAKRAQGGL